ncbi:MAG: Sporulation domain protein, partial [Myxococcales bacterium]|nr:Sporulation domain protein [Myxococcales bacterium]
MPGGHAFYDSCRMSRESELYRDKIEVSLDGRQIFYLFFGGAVIVGLVFVLGVMVGRRVEARGHIEHAQTAATADPLAALDRLETRGGLSFQGSLRGNEAPASDVDKTIGAIAKARQPATPAVAAPAAPAVAVVESPKKAEDKKADHKSETEKATKTDKPEKKLEVEKKDGEKRTGEKKLDAEKKADKKIEAGEKREIEKKE